MFFGIEYSLWFEFLLQGLDNYKLPITLGGTSNHFRVDVLKEVGLWDAYNVTEDADLGLRLYFNGYSTGMLDSYTMEEAPISLSAWIYQRIRWIKGFIKVFCVYLNSTTLQDITSNPRAHIGVIIFVGLSPYTFLIAPWLVITGLLTESKILEYAIMTSLIFSFSYMYSVSFIILKNNKEYISTKLKCIAFALWPFYFILHVISAYGAVFELLIKPFKWNKTTHNVSKITAIQQFH
jgi:cellulose synthase/poly-beta-1,6-N-acetylglucosamine synthase-like glycosyltransferase